MRRILLSTNYSHAQTPHYLLDVRYITLLYCLIRAIVKFSIQGRTGVVPNSQWYSSPRGSLGEYYKNFNRNNFEWWFTDRLKQILLIPSIIALDNAKYHRSGLVFFDNFRIFANSLESALIESFDTVVFNLQQEQIYQLGKYLDE